MSVNGSEGLLALELVQGYLRNIPALRTLLMVVKGILCQNGLGSATHGGLSSYVTTCMAVSFFQVWPSRLLFSVDSGFDHSIL
jgi:non-canonical poly(A) RNA polymerase PAPD5/7